MAETCWASLKPAVAGERQHFRRGEEADEGGAAGARAFFRLLQAGSHLGVGQLERQQEAHGQGGAGGERRDLAQGGRDRVLVRYMLTPVEATTAGRPASKPAAASGCRQEPPASKSTGTRRSPSGTP